MSLVVQPEVPTVSGPEEGPERSDFWSYLARKVGAAIVSFIMLLVVGFIIFSLMPSDPVSALTRGRPTSDAQMNQLRHDLGLDQPLWERFLTFVGNTLRGDLGYSYEYHQPVSTLIADRIWPTLLLMGTSTLISIWLGMWLGIRAGWRAGSVLDRSASAVSLALWSVPTFWLGLLLLMVFAAGIGPIPGIFPTRGSSSVDKPDGFAGVLDVAQHMVLPCLTLVAVVYAQYLLVMRSSVIDEVGQDYITTARAKGLRDDDVRRRHAVPNALLPTVTLVFMRIGFVVGGAVTVEAIFSWPGLGQLFYEAIRVPDFTLMQGTFLLITVSVIVMNTLADVVYHVLDPRVRSA